MALLNNLSSTVQWYLMLFSLDDVIKQPGRAVHAMSSSTQRPKQWLKVMLTGCEPPVYPNQKYQCSPDTRTSAWHAPDCLSVSMAPVWFHLKKAIKARYKWIASYCLGNCVIGLIAWKSVWAHPTVFLWVLLFDEDICCSRMGWCIEFMVLGFQRELCSAGPCGGQWPQDLLSQKTRRVSVS